ncbi:hypothetical protein GCM10022419_108690 [Nonomuraea rosea]|uniref:Uncharacterized protein n=2 Tax=Nonomuraea rosea TaxID=638574 RepID=A0ABP6ZEJ4_9ACTN
MGATDQTAPMPRLVLLDGKNLRGHAGIQGDRLPSKDDAGAMLIFGAVVFASSAAGRSPTTQ